MDSEKGNRVFARGHNVPPPPLVFGAQKKPGLDRVKESIGDDNVFNVINLILESVYDDIVL